MAFAIETFATRAWSSNTVEAKTVMKRRAPTVLEQPFVVAFATIVVLLPGRDQDEGSGSLVTQYS